MGRQSAVSRADLHPDAPCARADRDGGRDDLHFVTDGIESALEQAKAAAGDLDVKIGGGVSTVRQYLQAGLIDELHYAVSPVFLGQGEKMFDGIDLPALGFGVTEQVTSPNAMHVVLTKNAGAAK